MEKFVRFVMRFRILIGVLLIVFAAVAAIPLKDYHIDNSLEIWFFDDDPALKNYRYFQETYGNDELVTVALKSSSSFVTKENTKKLEALISTIKRLSSVETVYSVFNTPSKAEYLSKDSTATLFHVVLKQVKNPDAVRGLILADIKQIIEQEAPEAGWQYHLAGLGVIYNALNEIALSDSTLLIMISYVLIFIFLAFALRRPLFIVIGIFVVCLTLVVVLGLFFFFGKSINTVTMILPTLIMIFSIADIIHITNTYRRHYNDNPKQENEELVVGSIKSIIKPCFFTSLTTAVGFAALTVSRVQVIRDLGIFGAIGIMCAFVFSILFTIIFFSFIKKNAALKQKPNETNSRLVQLFYPKKAAVLIIPALFFIACIIGMFFLEVDTYTIQFFKDDHPVRKGSDFIENNFGAYTPLEFLVKPESGTFESPEAWKQLAEVEKKIVEIDGVTIYPALSALIANMAQQEDRESIKQILDYIPQNLKNNFMKKDYSEIRISTRIKMDSAQGFKKVIQKVMDNIPGSGKQWSLKVAPSGYLPLYVKMIDYITDTQVFSFIIAFFLVFGITFLLAGSIKLGLFAVIANLFPLVGTLGIMGLLGIRLDIATVTISAIAMGIVVDDTIHFLSQYKKTGEVNRTLDKVFRPIVSTSLILIFGFVVLLFAQVTSVIYFGLLSMLVIILALVGDIIILPALLKLFPGKIQGVKK